MQNIKYNYQKEKLQELMVKNQLKKQIIQQKKLNLQNNNIVKHNKDIQQQVMLQINYKMNIEHLKKE